MDVDRRHFVRTGTAGMLALAIPGWFTACRNGSTPSQGAEALAGPRAIARAKGRPLLVLRVEDVEALDADLGLLFGAFLRGATDEELAPLAACEITCATTAELAKLDIAGGTLEGARALLIDGAIATRAVVGEPPALDWAAIWAEGGEKKHTDSARARNAWLARQLADAVGTERPVLVRRAREEGTAVGVAPAAAAPSAKFAATWPNLARLRAHDEADQRVLWLLSIAATVRERCDNDPPAGSTWASNTGCGVRYETPPPRGEDSSLMIACGMGHVPEASARFLHFYSAEERAS